jgi:GMP synthase-like glutamine amidotransferase
MSKAIILQHVPYEGPGRLISSFRDFGIPTEVRRLDRGDEVPTDLEELRVLVILGGPMGVADAGKSEYPFLNQELDLLKRVIAHDIPTLGICLGAQLLAHAGGGKVYANVKMAPPAKHGEPPKPVEPILPLPELGWGGVTFPFPGGTEPMVMGMMDGAPMFHWHFDTFDLPRLPGPANPAPPPAPPPPTGNSLLSSTKLCKNQAFRFKTHLFGFQYHFEFTPADIEAVVANAGENARQILGSDGLAKIKTDTQSLYPRHERLGNRIIENFVQFLKVY